MNGKYKETNVCTFGKPVGANVNPSSAKYVYIRTSVSTSSEFHKSIVHLKFKLVSIVLRHFCTVYLLSKYDESRRYAKNFDRKISIPRRSGSEGFYGRSVWSHLHTIGTTEGGARVGGGE